MHICTDCGVTHPVGGDLASAATISPAAIALIAGAALMTFAAWRIAKRVPALRAPRLAAA